MFNILYIFFQAQTSGETDLDQLLADADTDYNNQENGECSPVQELDQRFGQEENIAVVNCILFYIRNITSWWINYINHN